MVWEVGGYVSHKLKSSSWGEGVVRQLSDYIRTKDPTARGWSYRTLYKMVQLYETYSSVSFANLIENTGMSSVFGDIVPFETAQISIQLQAGSVIQRSLVEFCKFLNEGGLK